jgi:hypothetical protein
MVEEDKINLIIHKINFLRIHYYISNFVKYRYLSDLML